MDIQLCWNLSTITHLGEVEVRLDKEPRTWVDEDGLTHRVYCVCVYDNQGNQLHEMFVKAGGIKVTTLTF